MEFKPIPYKNTRNCSFLLSQPPILLTISSYQLIGIGRPLNCCLPTTPVLNCSPKSKIRLFCKLKHMLLDPSKNKFRASLTNNGFWSVEASSNKTFKEATNERRRSAPAAVKILNNMKKFKFENCLIVQLILGLDLNFNKIILQQ